MEFDIKNLGLSDDSVRKELVKPDGTKTGIFLDLISTDHPRFKEIDRKVSLKMLKKMADGKKNISGININKIDPEESEKFDIERIAACIVGWDGLTSDGQPVPYSHDNAMKFLSYPMLDWVREIIREFAEDRANFTKG